MGSLLRPECFDRLLLVLVAQEEPHERRIGRKSSDESHKLRKGQLREFLREPYAVVTAEVCSERAEPFEEAFCDARRALRFGDAPFFESIP